jgi:hypothetical protein
MKKFLVNLKSSPLDVKLFFLNFILLFGILLFPDEQFPTLFMTYVFYVFVSTAILGVYITYVRESSYNVFRKETLQQRMIVLVVFLVITISISYVLAITDVLLWIF